LFSLVFSAVRARRAQAVALFLLTVCAVAAAAAAPWYLAAATESVARADIATAPVTQRVVSVALSARMGLAPNSMLASTRAEVSSLLPVPGATPVLGEQLLGEVKPLDANGKPINSNSSPSTFLAFRDGMCDQVMIEGSCPTGLKTVAISTTFAQRINAKLGSTLTFSSFHLRQPLQLSVVGIYTVREPAAAYWVGSGMLGTNSSQFTLSEISDAMLTADATVLAGNPDSIDVHYQVVIPSDQYVGAAGAALPGLLDRAARDLQAKSYQVQTEANQLSGLVARDQRLVRLGVILGAAQLLLLCWFALFLAVRYTAEERRADIALLKLRGAAGWRTWGLTSQQSALPMLAATAAGWLLGFVAARLLGGSIDDSRNIPGALLLSAASAVVAGIGALVAALLAEAASLRSPVSGLLRRVPGRRRGWRADLIDLAVFLLAIAGVYQGYADRGRPETSPLVLLAPGLVALAVGLAVARLLPLVSSGVGAVAIRTGRTGTALAALHLARRPGTNRVFAMLVVAVAVCTTSGLAWYNSDHAWSERAAQELGAARVLTVQAPSIPQLVRAVRAADPAGHAAMAATRASGTTPALAVDTSRLAAVALWSDGYGRSAAQTAALLHPVAPPAIRLTDGALSLLARSPSSISGTVTPIGSTTLNLPDTPDTAKVTLELATPDGSTVEASFGPIGAARAAYAGTLSGCPAPAGCRLVDVRMDREGMVELYGLSRGATVLIPGSVFGDVTRWRTSVGPSTVGPALDSSADHLGLALEGAPPAGFARNPRAYVIDAPSPLPVIQAGTLITTGLSGDQRVAPLGGEEVADRVVATAPVLPQVGRTAVMADLEGAAALVDAGRNVMVMQVWLTADAPPSIVDKLKAAGLVIVSDETLASVRTRFQHQGPATALRFELFTAAVGVLLAAGLLIVAAAVERRPRATELSALRTQGMSERAVRSAGYGSYAAVVIGAVAAGVVASLLAEVTINAALPIFVDGWSVLATGTGPEPVPIGVAAAVTLVLLGLAAFFAVRLMVRAVRHPETGGEA
jgi:hypothetical protein